MVDEVSKYCSPNAMPNPLAQWILDGRSFGCETLFATQQPNRINETILNEATELVCFRLQSRNAIATMAAQGFNEEEIANLPLGSYVAVNRETGAESRGRMW